MDVQLDEAQLAFRDYCGRLAADLASTWSQGRSPATVSSPVPDEATWRRIADAGWLGLRLPEQHGGAGASAVDVVVLVEQLGRHRLAAPVLGTLVAGELLAHRGASGDALCRVATGELRVAPALGPDLRTLAPSPATGLAIDAAGATHAVGAEDPVLWRLAAGPPTVDLTRVLARPELPDTTLDLRPLDGASTAAVEAFGLVGVSADLLGCMAAALDAALEHIRTREQFGAPIGSFQAVQQLAADSHVLTEAVRSAVHYAAWATDTLPSAEALDVARTTKAYASRSAIEVIEHVVQMFGGIAMTWESDVHVWLRRAHLSRRLLGDEHHHQAMILEALLEGADG